MNNIMVCGESWHAIKGSLAHRPSSQGWAPGVLPLCVCMCVCVCVCVWWFVFFLYLGGGFVCGGLVGKWEGRGVALGSFFLSKLS